jgi:hypothetical protein
MSKTLITTSVRTVTVITIRHDRKSVRFCRLRCRMLHFSDDPYPNGKHQSGLDTDQALGFGTADDVHNYSRKFGYCETKHGELNRDRGCSVNLAHRFQSFDAGVGCLERTRRILRDSAISSGKAAAARDRLNRAKTDGRDGSFTNHSRSIRAMWSGPSGTMPSGLRALIE